MQTPAVRISDLGPPLTVLASLAIIAGVASIVLSFSALADGEPYGYTRTVIGLVGILAGLMVLTGRRLIVDGWRMLTLWSVLQLPVYAETEGGNLFRQVFDAPLAATSSTRINGETVEYSQVGVNLVAVVLLIVVGRLRDRWDLAERARREASTHADGSA